MTQQEELVALRALVEEQKEELGKKDRIIKEKDDRIKEKDDQIKEKDDRIEQQDKRIRQLDIQVDNMIQALLHARKEMFGPSTEAKGQIEGQLSLFESVQTLAKDLGLEQKKITVKPYTRTPRQPGVRAEMLAGLPHEIEEYIIPPDDRCSVCGGELKVIGREVVRTEVEYIPAKLKIKQIIRQVAKCRTCGTTDGKGWPCHFQKAAVPAPPLPHSISSPSLIAQVMYQKYALGLPLARQEKDWYRLGLILPRNDMANWVIRCSQEWLEPVYWRILELLTGCGVLHMDETRIQCNKEKDKKAHSQSFMWVIRSAASEDIQATFFYYDRGRNGEVAAELLKGFHGYLVTDAYEGYEKVEGVKRSLCWAHVRRYLIDSIPLDSSGKELPGSKGAEGREYIRLLSKVEDKIKDLPYEEKVKERQEASRPILDAFWSWVGETSALSTTNVLLTKALNYASNQKKYLETSMEDGRLPLTNNLCPVREPYPTVRDRETGLALCGYPQRSEGQRGTLHTGGERKGQRSGRVWVSKVLIDGDAGQPSS